MITGCFHLFAILARAKPLPLKACLHYIASTFNMAGTIQNPSEVSLLRIPSARGAGWSLIRGLLWIWINLTRKEKRTQPKEL